MEVYSRCLAACTGGYCEPFGRTQQQVGVEGALVRLVDDDSGVATQEEILLDLPHEDAVRHKLDGCLAAHLPVIPHLDNTRPKMIHKRVSTSRVSPNITFQARLTTVLMSL